jgi:chromate transporter
MSGTVPASTPSGVPPMGDGDAAERRDVSLRELALYFLRLGALGFGGPIALAGYMQRDLQEQRRWISRDEFQDGLAIAQTMPGPLAAQLAMWIGFIRYGVAGATLAGVLFILPPFLLVVGIAAVYVRFEGLEQIRALFYGIGPAAIAIIALAAWKLAKSTDGNDPKLWVMSAVLMLVTIVTRTELAWLFVVAGILGIMIYAPPRRLRAGSRAGTGLSALVPLLPGHGVTFAAQALTAGTLVTLTLFFVKAAAFTFGSGLAIVPFLHEGVVVEHGWLNEREFLDAVALGIITPGPVVIMAAFVGYLAAGLPGAVLAAFGIFAPVWVFNVAIGRLFLRHRHNRQVRGFVKGATAAAVGAIAGASVVLGQGAITDVATVLIFASALIVLYLKKLKEPYVIGLAGIAGLVLFHG